VARGGALDRLKELLLAFHTFGKTYVTDPPCIDSRPYADRTQWLVYSNPHENTPRPFLAPLIHDAVVGVPTDALPGEIELVDLPGLRGDESPSALMYRQALLEADAALVFVAAHQLNAAPVESMLLELRKMFGDEADRRVWLVITKIDTLTAAHLTGEGTGMSFFDLIASFTAMHGIPLGQVCLIANGLRPIPEADSAVAKWPGLAAAYESLNGDGGIGRLRAVLADALPQCCAAWLEASVEQSLTALEARLERMSQLARPPAEPPT
jgi:hypothetical protein